jgi:hypothetical protein
MPAVVPSLTVSHIMCKLNERRKNQFGAPEEFMRRDGAALGWFANVGPQSNMAGAVAPAEHGY